MENKKEKGEKEKDENENSFIMHSYSYVGREP
jgi:hypothetical protein